MAPRDEIRLPYHRAPFYFAPEFLATPEQWRRSFSDLINETLSCEKMDAAIEQREEYEIAVNFGEVLLVLQAASGTFGLENVPIAKGDLWSWASNSPASFLADTLCSELIPSKLKSFIRTTLEPFAEGLFRGMECRFEKALDIGFAQIEARINSRIAEFVVVDPQDRRHITLDKKLLRESCAIGDVDNGLDDAAYDTGERLYSYSVVLGAGVGDGIAVEIGRRLPKKRNQKKGPGAPRRFRWDIFDQIIKDIMHDHPRWIQAQVITEFKKRASAKGFDLPKKTALESQVRLFFRDKKTPL